VDIPYVSDALLQSEIIEYSVTLVGEDGRVHSRVKGTACKLSMITAFEVRISGVYSPI
jgi:hypothetical protein